MAGGSELNKKELNIEAKKENLKSVIDFISEDICHLNEDLQVLIKVAMEEVFVNIASYAYLCEGGLVTIWIETEGRPLSRLAITFIDSGIPYNPLKRDDPELDVELMKRRIGGLGVYMVKESMDETTYEYKDGKNILTMVKKF